MFPEDEISVPVQPAAGPVREIDPLRAALFEQQVREAQSFGGALLAGGAAAIAGAMLWALVTVVAGFNTEITALVVGAAVGWAVRRFGQGVERKYAWLAA